MAATVSVSSKQVKFPSMPETLDARSVGVPKVLDVEDVALL